MKLKTSHHYIDVFGSQIAQKNVWFSHHFESVKKRQDVLKNRARRHHEGKIHAAQEYFDACRTYFSKRVEWEWDLVQALINSSGVEWSIMNKNKILKMRNPKRIRLPNDFRPVVEAENEEEWEKRRLETRGFRRAGDLARCACACDCAYYGLLKGRLPSVY
jgi:hypothetical protein